MIILFRLAVMLVVALALEVAPLQAQANTEGSAEKTSLSPYWGGAIAQWHRLIAYWADLRELDADLVAAVIRKESIGQYDVEGPAGAVGLMMVLPAEISGLPWRPSAAELKQPHVNLRWGTGILDQVIEESGSLLSALAAYNGGWDQIHLEVTQRYARSVLTYYAYALGARFGLRDLEEEAWSLVLVTRVDGRIKRFETVSSDRSLASNSQQALPFPATEASGRRVLPGMADTPRARVAHYTDQEGREVEIHARLYIDQPPMRVGETRISAGPATYRGRVVDRP
jgi:hypothetical protein